MKKYNDILREYSKRLNEDELKYISIRLARRLGGDLGEAVELIQKHSEVDRWLSSANSAGDFFDMIDQVDVYVQQEIKKRLSYEQKGKAQSAR
jgi:hypothetical protein